MRLWEVHFQIYQYLPNFPVLKEIVKEIQNNPNYRINENFRSRKNNAQLLITQKGRGVFEKDGRTWDLVPGKAFLAETGTPNVSYYYPEDSADPWIFLWISFEINGVQTMLNDLLNTFGHIYDISEDSRIIERLYQFKPFRNTVQTMSMSAGGGLIMEILALLGQSKVDESKNDSQNQLICRARQYVMENIEFDFGTADIADDLGISREHLSRIFNKNEQMSLSAFIREKRIAAARHLLREKNLTCADIAKKIGYQNTASFTRTFKSMVGTTPNEFRKLGM